MIILTGKALILFCLIFVYPIEAQPPYPFTKCNNDSSTYTPNSTYSRNLDAALSSLRRTNSGNGYFNSSVGQGTDTVNAMCLCRGDVELNMCLSCLSDSIFRLRVVCPNQREAVIYYEFCLLKYSNGAILENNDMMVDLYYLNNFNNATDKEEFDGVLLPFMNRLKGEAAGGNSLLKFAMEDTRLTGSDTLYGLTQCIPTLSESQCNDCLEFAINQFPVCCDGKVGGIVLMARCNLRYETYEFYINSALAPPSQRVPSPPGKNTSRTRTLIIIIIPTVGAIVIASICILLILRRKKNLAKKGMEMLAKWNGIQYDRSYIDGRV